MIQNNAKIQFLCDIKRHLEILETYRSSIYNNVTDRMILIDNYMNRLRRIFRVIEGKKSDSRVANIISKNKDLFINIKIRDYFEHNKKPEQPTNEELKEKLRISKNLTVFVQAAANTEADRSISVTSENYNWNFSHDHNLFIKVLEEFRKLYPFNCIPCKSSKELSLEFLKKIKEKDYSFIENLLHDDVKIFDRESNYTTDKSLFINNLRSQTEKITSIEYDIVTKEKFRSTIILEYKMSLDSTITYRTDFIKWKDSKIIQLRRYSRDAHK